MKHWISSNHLNILYKDFVNLNTTKQTYVAMNWDAGGGTTSANSDGLDPPICKVTGLDIFLNDKSLFLSPLMIALATIISEKR